LRSTASPTKRVTITPVPFSVMQEALAAGKIDLGMFPQPLCGARRKADEGAQAVRREYGVPFERGAQRPGGKRRILTKNAAAIALCSKTLGVDAFYLAEPRAARQALIAARFVRVDPEVYMTCRTTIRDPTFAGRRRCRSKDAGVPDQGRVPAKARDLPRWSTSAPAK